MILKVRLSRHRKLVTGLIVLAIVALTLMSSTTLSYLRGVPLQTIEYAIDPSVQGIERELLMNATKQAVTMWSDLNPGLSFVVTDKSDVLQITSPMPWYVDVLANIIRNPISGVVQCQIWDTDATTCVMYIHQNLLRADAGFSLEERTDTVAHELGHVLGLAHYPCNQTHLMGTPGWNPAFSSYDTKGYAVPERTFLP